MVRSKFNAKYVDFVACNKLDLEVFAIVEYDGTGHNSKDDNERDRLLREAGYRVERFSTLDTPQSIRGRFGRSDRSSATVAFATPSSDKSPLYFVYGSSMNRDLMRQRYPDCKPVGIASLPDHRLAFPRHSQKQGCAIAGIEPEDGELVWGVLFDLGTGEKLHIDAGAIAETDQI